MTANVKKFLIPDFETVLLQDNYLVIKNFGVQRCVDKWKKVPSEWKINFYRLTRAHVVVPFHIQSYGIIPVSYVDLIEFKYAKSDPIDVIGELITTRGLTVKKEDTNETKSIEFVLQDVSGETVECIVWGDHASKLLEYVSNNKTSADPIVILIHNVKLTKWRDLPQVSNQLFGCRLFINEAIDEVEHFKKVLKEATANEDKPVNVTVFVYETRVENELDKYKDFDFHMLTEVRACATVKSCVAKATIVRTLADEGWFGYGCTPCGTKVGKKIVGPNAETMWQCSNCYQTKSVYPKIRDVVAVEDKSGTTSFVLFENQLAKVLKKSVSWLYAKALKLEDPHVIPKEFDTMYNKPFVFKVRIGDINVNDGYPCYTVDRVTIDQLTLDYVGEKLAIKFNQLNEDNVLIATPVNKGKEVEKQVDDLITPENVSVKRKRESSPDSLLNDGSTSTSKTVVGVEALKFPRLEDI